MIKTYQTYNIKNQTDKAKFEGIMGLQLDLNKIHNQKCSMYGIFSNIGPKNHPVM